MDNESVGPLLREERLRSSLTLEKLAEMSGVSVRAISDMERGKSRPRQATLRELMDAMDLDEEARRRLVRAAVRRTHQVPRQLPPDLTVFRGRHEALTTVHGLTSQIAAAGGHVVISAIGGMAGVGKTTLAVHWAHQVADRFPDGQLYVNLRGFEDAERPLDPGEALGRFLGALGVEPADMPADTEARTALFRERTRSRRMIVVLDNARDAEQVRPLLPASPGCLTIATSRNRLAALAAAEGASLVSLDVWTPQEALAALAARIGEERCRSEPEAAAALTELCGHLPLAIAVVGAQLSAAPGMPLRVGVRELREARPRLDALADDDRRIDVRAVFSWSYRALTDEAATFFRHLSLHPGPAVSAEAAASLAGTEMARARRHLRELTSASLLSRDAEGRYVLHDLVRAYGVELSEQRGDDPLGAGLRLLDYLRHNAHAANRFVSRLPSEPIGPPVPGVAHVAVDSREEGLEWYRQEEPTAAAAVRGLQDPRLLRHRVALALEWEPYNRAVGRWTEEIATARIALDAALVLDDPTAIARAGTHLSSALCETGRADEANEPVDLMLGQLDRLPPKERLLAERYASRVRDHQKRYAEGLRHARASLEIARTLDESYEVARATAIVGYFHSVLGDHQATIATCEAALPLLRRTGNRHDEAATWESIGRAQQRMGDLGTAIATYRKALYLYEQLRDDYNAAEVLDCLASARLEQGAADEARAHWTRAGDLFTGLRVARAEDMYARARALPRPRAHSAE
ncbi:ATP-binding protein [Streptomyces sp. cg28]|uniref:ATP-binding protein n=1 Tax=Streptomyces sp. cg28 TaxID=3403457 RepID=UPI003B21E0FC